MAHLQEIEDGQIVRIRFCYDLTVGICDDCAPQWREGLIRILPPREGAQRDGVYSRDVVELELGLSYKSKT